jgi:hydroxyethylthiazole kinase-like uncharacterized protein yjeF
MKSITPSLLRRFPLRTLDDADGKNERGVVLVVAGSRQVPGAALLAGLAALRVGAGKLQLGAPREAAIPLGIAVPEALVATGNEIARIARAADAILIGPGMSSTSATVLRARRLARSMREDATLVLDAAALPAAGVRARTIITPHTAEMARLMEIDEEDVRAHAPDVALAAADRFGAVVALKGPTTYVAADGDLYVHDGGSIGLATSGSGDTLAGIIAGLAASCGDPLAVTLWGVWAHGAAGRRLSRRVGRAGFLARELLAELPAVIRR